MSGANRDSGLSDYELQLEGVIDKIKAEPSTIKAIKVLNDSLRQKKYFSIDDMEKAYYAGESNVFGNDYPPFEEWFKMVYHIEGVIKQ